MRELFLGPKKVIFGFQFQVHQSYLGHHSQLLHNESVDTLSLLPHGGDPGHSGQQPGRTVKSATDSNINININIKINISIKDTFKKVYCLLISGEYLYRWEKEMRCHQKLRQLLKVVLDQNLF